MRQKSKYKIYKQWVWSFTIIIAVILALDAKNYEEWISCLEESNISSFSHSLLPSNNERLILKRVMPVSSEGKEPKSIMMVEIDKDEILKLMNMLNQNNLGASISVLDQKIKC